MSEKQDDKTRRQFLQVVGGCAGVLGGCGVGGQTVEYPQDYPPSDRARVDGGGADAGACARSSGQVVQGPRALDVGYFKPVRVGGTNLWVCRDGSGLFALDYLCTHLSCPLSYKDATTTWECGCHGSAYTFSGGLLSGPATAPMRRYAVCEASDGTTLIDTSRLI